MATVAAKAARKAQVRQRLDREIEELAGRLNLQIPDEPRPSRDPELDAILGLERQETILHSINVALGEHGIAFDLSNGDTEPEEAEDLTKLKRPELDAMATELGIETPEKLKNKEAVIAAIEQARAAQDNDPDPSPEEGNGDQLGKDQSPDESGGDEGTGEPTQDPQPEGTGEQEPPAE